jgi:hypothetical protein
MAKRFTDTIKWNKRFFRNLSNNYKLLWIYILDKCDHAGVWEVDFDEVELKLGVRFDPKEALNKLDNRAIEFRDGEKWFIPDFVTFQYGEELNMKVKAQWSAIQIIKKYNLEQYLDTDLPWDDSLS